VLVAVKSGFGVGYAKLLQKLYQLMGTGVDALAAKSAAAAAAAR